jgi:hypothetical protein
VPSVFESLLVDQIEGYRKSYYSVQPIADRKVENIMALRANRGGAPKAQTTSVPAGNVDQHANQQTVQNGGNHMTNQTPAPRNQSATPAVNNNPNQMAVMNAGILDNIDDITGGGNYVSIDGTNFLYKASNETATEIIMVVSFGKRFYQWFDEDNNKYNNSDTKLDDRYKLKFEIRWFEEGEEGEPTEYIMTLPTASAMNFIDYVKAQAKAGFAINQIYTKMTISRQENRNDKKIRYSRVEFENVGVVEAE